MCTIDDTSFTNVIFPNVASRVSQESLLNVAYTRGELNQIVTYYGATIRLLL